MTMEHDGMTHEMLMPIAGTVAGSSDQAKVRMLVAAVNDLAAAQR